MTGMRESAGLSLEELKDMKAVACGHLEVGDDVGGEFELSAISEFTFACEIGDGFLTAGGELDFVFVRDALKSGPRQKEVILVVVYDEQGEFLSFHRPAEETRQLSLREQERVRENSRARPVTVAQSAHWQLANNPE